MTRIVMITLRVAATACFALILSVTAGFMATAQVVDPRVPLPADVAVEVPGADVPEHLQRFSGVWAFGTWGGRMEHILVVERISATGAVNAVYANGEVQEWRVRKGHFRVQGQIRDDVLSLSLSNGAQVTYQISDDRLAGAYLLAGRTTRIVLVRAALEDARADASAVSSVASKIDGGTRRLPVAALQQIVVVVHPERAP